MHGKSRQGLIILLAFYKRWFKVQFHWLLHFKIYLLCAEEPPEMFCKKVFLKMSPTGMQHRLQKRIQKRLNTGVFMKILRDFQEHLFKRTSAYDCFCLYRFLVSAK